MNAYAIEAAIAAIAAFFTVYGLICFVKSVMWPDESIVYGLWTRKNSEENKGIPDDAKNCEIADEKINEIN